MSRMLGRVLYACLRSTSESSPKLRSNLKGSGCVQVWDAWQRFVQPLVGQVSSPSPILGT